MCNFSAGLMVGTIMGASIILAVHPMNKRSMRKAYHRAGRMMNKMSDTLRDWT
ncbi:MAG: hypothetical protein IKW62_06045 [Clostridia bacterium]|nr:hypothetical protein [Clostridia bacterium]